VEDFQEDWGLLLRGGCEVVVELAIFRVEENLTIKEKPLSFVVVACRKGEPSCHSGDFRGSLHLSNVTSTSPSVGEHGNTSSSPCVSVISIPEFTFLVIAIVFEVYISCYHLCYIYLVSILLRSSFFC
jgi:hypothetical protein